MKRIFRIVLLFSVLLSIVCVRALADTVYSVTLNPGQGAGEPITYCSSDEGAFSDSRDDAQNGQFYHESDGSVGFMLKKDYCPATFMKPSEMGFNGWWGLSGSDSYHTLSSTETIVTAQWKNRDGSACFSLSPLEITLEHFGWTEVSFMVDNLFYGTAVNGRDTIAFRILFETCKIEEKDIALDNVEHIYRANSQSEGRNADLALNAKPMDFADYTPEASLTGILTYKSWWMYQNPDDPPYTYRKENFIGEETHYIAVTLVVPKPTYTVSVTADPAAGGIATGGGDFMQDEKVALTASANPGYYFRGWEVTPDSVSLENGQFNMPATNVTVTAVFDVLPNFGPAAFIAPADLAAIRESAFAGDTSITVVDAGNCASIGRNAFKGCSSFNQIRLPKNCSIDPDAFNECGTVFVFAPDGGDTQTSCDLITNCVFVPENRGKE